MEIKLSLGQIRQTVVKECQVAQLRLSESVYPAHLKTPKHSHQHACFCLVLSGASLQTYGLKTRERKPNTMLFYSPDDIHYETFGESGSRIFSVEISSEWLHRYRECSLVQIESQMFEGGLLNCLARRLYREFYNSDTVAPLAIEGLMLEILAEASRYGTMSLTHRPPVWLARAKDLIHSEFSQDLSLDNIARRVGVHPVYLASAFRRYYGYTVGEYLRKLRIEFAQNEIISSDFPLAQIAVAAGFANQAHFTRVFKQQIGMTPGKYRASFHFS